MTKGGNSAEDSALTLGTGRLGGVICAHQTTRQRLRHCGHVGAARAYPHPGSQALSRAEVLHLRADLHQQHRSAHAVDSRNRLQQHELGCPGAEPLDQGLLEACDACLQLTVVTGAAPLSLVHRAAPQPSCRMKQKFPRQANCPRRRSHHPQNPHLH